MFTCSHEYVSLPNDRKRETERDRETERQRDRQRERETDRQTDRQTDLECPRVVLELGSRVFAVLDALFRTRTFQICMRN